MIDYYTARPAGFWIGHPGALLSLPGIKGQLVRDVERSASFVTSAAGLRRAYLSARRAPLREWKCSIPYLRPEEVALLQDLLLNTDPPYVWVDPQARVTNLLTPAAAALRRTVPALPLLGRQPLDGGGYAATGAGNPTGLPVRIEPAPVVVGMPVTVSAYLAAASAGRVAAAFLDSAGHRVGTPFLSAAVTGLGGLRRAYVTATPPTGAAAVEIEVTGASVIAQPAVTWTAQLLEYGPGGGANEVVITKVSETLESAALAPERNGTARDPRLSGLDFTVYEVG